MVRVRQEALGLELLEEVQAALSRIERNPGIGLRYLNIQFRFYRVKRFLYVIYYLELEDHICVMAIAHERRRPDYWTTREPE
jgi:toxin ParE1/3/4